MNNQTHTPGPWRVTGTHENKVEAVKPNGEGFPIADCTKSCNACLIAAAPALFEIVQRIQFQESALAGGLITSGHTGAQEYFRETRRLMNDCAALKLARGEA